MVKIRIRRRFLDKKRFFSIFALNITVIIMAYIILLLYAALVFLTIKTKQTFTPAGAMVFVWTTLTSILLIFFRDWVTLRYSGLFYMVAGVSAFLIGSIVAQKTAKSTNKIVLLRFNRRMVAPVLGVIIALGFVNPVYSIYANGFSLSNMFAIEDLTNMTKEFSTIRYSKEDATYSKYIQIFLTFTYAAPLAGGFCWLLVKRVWQKVLCICSVLPCLIITISQSAKLPAISALLFFMAGIITAIVSYNIKIKITLKLITTGVCVAILFFSGLFYSLLTRWGEEITDYKIERNKISFFDYAFGSIMCFDEWFYNETHNIDYSTTLLHNSKLFRLGFFQKVENGVRVDFNPAVSNAGVETYGRENDEFQYDSITNYTIQFEVQCNVKPDSVIISLFSQKAHPKGHFFIKIENEEQIAPDKWRYSQTFAVDSSRSLVRTPDIILSLDSASYFEITKLRLDTGTVAQPWVNGSGNMFYRDNSLKFGKITFMGIFNALGLVKRQLGLYRDFVYFGRLDKTMRSNVYSAFRLIIEDFGKVFGLVFLLIMGFISRTAITFIQQRKHVFICQCLLVAIYSYVFWSFATSIWVYTSNICAFGLSFFIFSILQKPLHGDTWVTKIVKKLKSKQK